MLTSLNYESFQGIGIAKEIIKESSGKKYKCINFDYLLYGGVEVEGRFRKRMQSMLFQFVPMPDNTSHAQIYYEDVLSSLNQPNDLEE